MLNRNDDSFLREARFSPFRKGMGPKFILRMWDTYKTDSLGKSILSYELRIIENGKSVILFTGKDYHCSPCEAIDSNDTLLGLMGFLTLKPGDTDREYFEGYTPEQLEYCDKYAEHLDCAVHSRFGDY